MIPDEFLFPNRLWLLAGVGAMALAYGAVLRWRTAATVRFTQIDLLERVAPKRPRWRRHVVALLQLCGLAAGVVAIARPVTTTLERVRSEGRIIVLLDVSNSMAAEDVAPTRLAAAQQAATEFIDQVEADVEVGLVSFSGTVKVEVQPTLDRTALSSAVAGLQLDDSTAIGDAIIAGTNLLLQSQDAAVAGDEPAGTSEAAPGDSGEDLAPGALVLLSDGETTQGRSTEEGAQYAATSGVPVFTIAFGTPDGTIENPLTGEIQPVPVSPEPLAAAAETTGGESYEAASGADLDDAYQRIRDVLGETLGEEIEIITERTWQWAAGAVAILAAAWLLALWWLRGMV
jgi:Ca-activated chloride channel family protein